MTGFAKLTGKTLRALAEEYEVQLPAGRITKGKLIEILEAENIQPPWDGPEMEMPNPGQLDEGGTPSRSRPPADLAGSSSSLAGLQGGKRLWLGRSLSPGSPEKEVAAFIGEPESLRQVGRSWSDCRGSRRSHSPDPFPLEERRLPGFGWGALFLPTPTLTPSGGAEGL